MDRLIWPALDGKPVAWFSPTYKMLTETWRELRRNLQPVTTRVSEQEHRIELLGGGVIECWSLETPDGCRGRKYKRIVIDEAAMIRDLMATWQMVIRPTLTDYQGDAWFLSTPRGMNDFQHLYNYAHDGNHEDWAAWCMPTSTNPYIPGEELESAKRDMGPLAYAQEYEADFTAIGDVGFPEFKRTKPDGSPYHQVPTDYDMIARWRRVAAHDYGYTSPAATLWFAIDPLGGAIAYREWSGRKMHPDEIAQLTQYLQGDERPVIYGDPSLFKLNGKAYLTAAMIADLAQAGKLDLTVGKQYADAGMTMQPANNARVAGFLKLHSLLAPRQSDGVPYLRFMDCCSDAIATFENLQLDPDRSNDVLSEFPESDPVWLRDEFYDVTRYAMMGIPSTATTGVKPYREPDWNM